MGTGPGNAIFFIVSEICVLCVVVTAVIVPSNLFTLLSMKRFHLKQRRSDTFSFYKTFEMHLSLSYCFGDII